MADEQPTPSSTTKPAREYINTYERNCRHCGQTLQTWNLSARYCGDRCKNLAWHQRRRKNSEWLNEDVTCRICGTIFRRTPDSSPNRKFCSEKCQVIGRRQSMKRFSARNPSAAELHRLKAYKKRPNDSLLTRLYRKYPDLPRRCEARGCWETRVLEAAHKPAFRRNGAWRTMSQYERHMFWMLCPTCHKLVDMGYYTPDEMGLKL